jgi:hypothetical protein
MIDGKRKIANDIPIINRGWIHHTTGVKYNGYSSDQVFDDLNGIGYSRGYGNNGYDFATGYSKEWGQNQHKHTLSDGSIVISYCEYHYAIYEFAPEGTEEPDLHIGGALPKIKPAEYRIVSLIDDPLWMDARSVGLQRLGETHAAFIARANEMNSDSLAFVFCGNFEIQKIPEPMVEFFIIQFAKDKPLGWILEKNPGFDFKGHRDSGDQTACPGQYLYTYIARIAREVALTNRYL